MGKNRRMSVVQVSNKKELFIRQMIFYLKCVSLKDREEVYRFPNGREVTASVKMFEKFRTLQRLLWVYCFPVVFIHEFSHTVVAHLLDPWGPPYRATKKKRIKTFLAILAGPLSDVIICVIGILSSLWIPLKLYLISSSLIPLVIWTIEDFRGLLMVIGLWKPSVITYGFSKSRSEWYADLFDRNRKQRVLRHYAPDEQGILQEVEDLKRLFKTNIVERKDIE